MTEQHATFDPVHVEMGGDLPGWYFWDADGIDRHGPFGTREEATAALDVHCGEIEGSGVGHG